MPTYDPPGVCGVKLLPGTKALGNELARLFDVPPPAKVGGYAPRCVYGHEVTVGAHTCPYGHVISFHAESRAFDAMTADKATQARIVAWLLDHTKAWGVQEIITGWGGTGDGPRRWKAGAGWADYHGPSNHRDHVHVSQTIAAANALPPPKVVVAMYDPALVLRPIVAALASNEGPGAWLLGDDGSVYAFGGAVFYGSANGQPWWGARRAAQLEYPSPAEHASGRKYVIVATTGERYALPT